MKRKQKSKVVVYTESRNYTSDTYATNRKIVYRESDGKKIELSNTGERLHARLIFAALQL